MSTPLADIANGLYAEKPTSALYHYTSIGGLLGIVRDGALRATEVHYLSDASELRLSGQLLRGAAGAPTAHDEFGQHLFSQFFGWLDNRVSELGHALFVACFTADGNLLSQWRSYSEPGKGISVGFDPGKLSEAAAGQSWQIGRCIYDPTRQRILATSVLDTIDALARQRFDSPEKLTANATRLFFEELESDILRIAIVLKHASFREEQEWRAISPITSRFPGTPGIAFRQGRSMLVPYMSFELPKGEGNPRLLIDHVWVGPTPHPNESVMAIMNYLSCERAHPRLGVGWCQTPYRSW